MRCIPGLVVVEFRQAGVEGSKPLYRLFASVADTERASAQQGDGWFRWLCSQCVGNRLQA